MDNNQIKIDAITAKFFNAFTNANGKKPNVNGIREYFLPEGILINNTLGMNKVYNLEGFIETREQILSSGNLTEFSEEEVLEKTEINNTVAQRSSHYKKSGLKDGHFFNANGIKNFQFLNTDNGWKIASVVWCDIS